MADRFHVNADGDSYKCFARIKCPFGDMEADHYATPAAARAAYEKKQEGNLFPDTSNLNGKKGYTITNLTQIDGDDKGGPMIQMPVKRGFATPDEAISWAKENIPHAGLINVLNEDWEQPTDPTAPRPSKESGEWKELRLVDVSEEAQALESRDIPTIAKYYLKNSKDRIVDVHSLRLVTAHAAQKLSPAELGRLRGYLKAATYGKK